MRDRSWTPRRETSSRTRRGYTYGADGDGRGFYVATSVAPGSEDGTDEVIGGYLLQDGEVVPVKGGERRVGRDDQHRPSGVVLEMAPPNGMPAAAGAAESRLAGRERARRGQRVTVRIDLGGRAGLPENN